MKCLWDTQVEAPSMQGNEQASGRKKPGAQLRLRLRQHIIFMICDNMIVAEINQDTNVNEEEESRYTA